MKDLMRFTDFNSNPMRMLNEVERDMRRFLDSMNGRFLEEGPQSRYSTSPACEVQNKDSHFLMNFDLPGVPKDKIKIEVKDGQIHVSGERKTERSEQDYTERSHGQIYRSMTLPQGVKEEDIQAHYENGVLSIALPKSEKSRPRKVSITEGEKQGIWKRLLSPSQKTDTQQNVDLESSKERVA